MVEQFRPLEKNFEDHFCDKLEGKGFRKRDNGHFDNEDYLDFALIEEFLRITQPEELKEVISEYGERWKKDLQCAIWVLRAEQK